MGCPACGCNGGRVERRDGAAVIVCDHCGAEGGPAPDLSRDRSEPEAEPEREKVATYAPHRTVCPGCGSNRTRTASTRKGEERTTRHHKCYGCGRCFKTNEAVGAA